MKAIERHRQNWQGKSDEWLFERLDNELKQKVEEIHRLLAENETLRSQTCVVMDRCLYSKNMSDIKTRLIEEKAQLEEKLDKLNAFLVTEKVKEIDEIEK